MASRCDSPFLPAGELRDQAAGLLSQVHGRQQLVRARHRAVTVPVPVPLDAGEHAQVLAGGELQSKRLLIESRWMS
jgi:hypothetical protein